MIRDVAKTYISNMEESFRLMKPELTSSMSEKEILDRIRRDAERLYTLRCENDRILKEEIFRFPPEDLTAEDCDTLSEMANQCSHFMYSIDAGAAYRIHKLLYQAAELHGDVKHMIAELYWQGLGLYNLNLKVPTLNLNPHGEQMNACFVRAASYFDQYEQLPDSETRSYVIRSMANRNLVRQRALPRSTPYTEENAIRCYELYMDNFRQVMDVVRSPYYRALDPTLPWDQYEYSLNYDRTTFVELLAEVNVPYIAQDFYQSAVYIYQRQKGHSDEDRLQVAPRAASYYTIARYFIHQLTAGQLTEQLLKLYHTAAKPGDFSPTGNFANLSVPAYLREFSQYLSPEEKDRFHDELAEVQQSSRQYLVSVPFSNYNARIALTIRDRVLNLDHAADDVSYRLLDSILTAHAPTYVHSLMVAGITRELVTRLLDVAPETMEGTLDLHGTEELLANRGRIQNLAWKCGLYHDVGKSMVINYICIYGRSLLDEEFTCIKLHPQLGYYLLSGIPGFEDVAQAALRHHINYDGKGGYPRDCGPCPQRVRAIVDALTIADSMDAATDNIGRCYAAAKSYETLVGELFRFSGTRYAPQIVELFRDEDFRSTLGRYIDTERRSVYGEVYGDIAKAKEPEAQSLHG